MRKLQRSIRRKKITTSAALAKISISRSATPIWLVNFLSSSTKSSDMGWMREKMTLASPVSSLLAQASSQWKAGDTRLLEDIAIGLLEDIVMGFLEDITMGLLEDIAMGLLEDITMGPALAQGAARPARLPTRQEAISHWTSLGLKYWT